MRRLMGLEITRYKKNKLIVALTSATVFLVFFYFFALIGRFDNSSPDSVMFRDYASIIAFSATITFAVLVVLQSVFYARFIVLGYIGSHRIQTYIYPRGRSQLFRAKNAAFTVATASAIVVGLLVAVVVLVAVESLAPLVRPVSPVVAALPDFGVSILSVILMVVGGSVVSGIVGIIRASTIATIVSSVIFVAVTGNFIAMLFTSSLWLTLSSSLTIAATAMTACWLQAKRIDNDEIL